MSESNNNSNQNTQNSGVCNNNNASKSDPSNYKQTYKDSQFFNKLCSNNIVTNKFALNKINNKSAANTQSSKFTSYIDRNTFTTIYEGKVKELLMTFATPNSATIIFYPVGYPKTITLNLQSQTDPLDTQSISILTSPYIFQNLKPHSTYDITTIASYSSRNVYTEKFANAIVTLNEGPATNIKLFNITNHTISISFVFPIGVYNSVDIQLTNQTDNSVTNITNITTSGYDLTGLNINTTYKILLTSVYIVTKNKYSVSFSASTLYEEFPENITFTNVTNVSATISYQYTGLPIYNNIIVVNNTDPTETYNINTLENIIVLDNLTHNITYNVSIVSVYSSGNRFPVEIPNAFYILNEGLPQQVNIEYVKGTSILFSFTNAIGNPSYYELVLTNTENSSDKIIEYITIDNTKNIIIGNENNNINLSSNSTYSFELKSVYLQTGNTYIYSTQFKTLNEGIVQNFTITFIGNNYISFTYKNPPGNKYFVNLTANSSSDYKTLRITSNSYVLENLLVNNTYTLSISIIYQASNTTYTYNYPYPITTLYEGPSVISSINNNITDIYAYIQITNQYSVPDQYIFTSTNNLDNTKIITTENSNGNPIGQNGINILISGLLGNSVYTTTLQTMYSTRIYPSIQSFQINTKGYPTNLLIGNYITDVSASITFVAPKVLPDYYILNENGKILDISLNKIITTNINNGYLEINGLTPNTLYSMTFGPYYALINTTYAIPFPSSFITKGPVQMMNVSNITISTASLSFSSPLLAVPPNNDYWNYNIYLYNYDYGNKPILYNTQNSDPNNTYLNETNTNFIFTNLTKNTFYVVEVDAVYNYNNGEIAPQIFTNYYDFITLGSPDNLYYTNIRQNAFTLVWTTIYSNPEYYYIEYTYNPTRYIQIPSNQINIVGSVSSYTLQNADIKPDISYSNITVSSYYPAIDISYITTSTPLTLATNAPPIFSVLTQTNTTIDISFVTPSKNIPDTYIITLNNTSLNNTSYKQDISLNTLGNYTNSNNYLYTITNILDNTNYNITMSSYYNINKYEVSGNIINASTHGTPVILSFFNIYQSYVTIEIQPLFIQPVNYTLYINNQPYTFLPSELDVCGNYTTPIIPRNYYLVLNTIYQITIISNYPNMESYTSIQNTFITPGKCTNLSFVTTDISCIVTFQPPYSNPTSYNYTLSSSGSISKTVYNIPVYNNIDNTKYFLISNLQTSAVYDIQVISVYPTVQTVNGTVTNAYSSDKGIFYTKGVPTNISINPALIYNTYFNIKFTTPYNCSNYTVYALSINSETPITQNFNIQSPANTLSDVSYTLLNNTLLEDTSYNIYIVSNYNNYVGKNNNILQITTYNTNQIFSINNITDVSANILIKAPIIIPNSIQYTIGSIQKKNIPFKTILSGKYLQFVINDLSQNTQYNNLSITSNYTVNNASYTSSNVQLATKGITNISTRPLDTSVTVSFSIPFISPELYYYVLGTNSPVSIFPNNNSFTINGLVSNTFYPTLYIQTKYSDISGVYNSQIVSFYTRMIPVIINYQASDIDISINFTKPIYTANVIYSYTLIAYITALNQSQIFTPNITSDGSFNLYIPTLTPNTFYSTFQINIYNTDINYTFSSRNLTFNTMGNPTQAIMKTPPNNNNKTAILSFYPPLYPADYYIITNPNSPLDSSYIYPNDMSYNNNVYSYTLNNIARNYLNSPYDMSYIGITISSYYNIFNKTIPLNTFNTFNIVNSNSKNVISIATNNTGRVITFISPPNIVYNSFDYGNSWSQTSIQLQAQDNRLIKVVMDNNTGNNQYIISLNFVYKYNTNSNPKWSSILNFSTQYNDICIDNSGQTVFIGSSSGDNQSQYSTDFGNNFNTLPYSINKCIINDLYLYVIGGNTLYQILKSNINQQLIQVYNGTNITNICTNKQNTNLLLIDNNAIYKSTNGNIWNLVPDSSLNWNSISSDTTGDNIIAINNNIGAYISNNGGIHWNVVLSSTSLPLQSLQNAIISGNGNYVYAYDTSYVYYYNIPLVKSAVNKISVANTDNTSTYLSFNPPSYIPDLSYTIVLSNIPNSETYTYYTNTTQSTNILLTGLTQNTLYDISINANYSNIPQSFTNVLSSAFCTKSAPINLSNTSVTDASALIQFTVPNIIPDSYTLDICGTITENITLNNDSQSILLGYYTLNDLSINTNYVVKLYSIYNGFLEGGYVSNDISFNTRGYPSNLFVSKIYDTNVNLSFSAPLNTTNLLLYSIRAYNSSFPNLTVTKNTTNNTDYIFMDLYANNQYDITLTSRYTNPMQDISNNNQINQTIITKGGCTIDVSNVYSTNQQIPKVLIHITSPLCITKDNSLLDYYELYINNNVYKTQNNIIEITDLTQNTIYNSVYVQTYYSKDVSFNISSNLITVITEGYPSNIQSDYDKITDITATIKYTLPYTLPVASTGGNNLFYTLTLYDSNQTQIGENRNTIKITEATTSFINLSQSSAYVLTPNTQYNITIQSNYPYTINNYLSPYIPFITASPIFNFTTSNITDISATISFTPQLLLPLYYKVIVTRNSDNFNILQYNISNTTYSYTIANLPTNTSLSISIVSVYPSINLNSNSISITTYGPPTNINIYSITDVSAIMSFSQINTNTIAQLTNTTNKSSKTIPILSSPHILTDLSSNSNYELILQTYFNTINLYSNSNIIGFATEGPVSNIITKNEEDAIEKISFTPSVSTPNRYTLIVSPSTIKGISSFSNITNPYILSDLSLNTQYNIDIQTNYDNNWNTIFG